VVAQIIVNISKYEFTLTRVIIELTPNQQTSTYLAIRLFNALIQ